MWRKPFFLSIFLMVMLFFCAGCSEDQKGDYKGVSELITSRNQARSSIKKKPGSTTASEQKETSAAEQHPDQQGVSGRQDEEEISPIILYEEKVIIVSQSSDKKLAEGIAYINKQGQIVRLKISQ